MVTVHLKYFAMLREVRACDEETLTVAEGMTAEHLYEQLFPVQHMDGLPVSFAINQQYAKPSAVLADQDEVVFLPPVGGG